MARSTPSGMFRSLLFFALFLYAASFASAATQSSTSLAAAPNPSTFGQSVMLTATVTDATNALGSAPTGNVTFKADGNSIGTVALVGAGDSVHAAISVSISTLTLGSHTLTAEYAGDGKFDPSSTDGVPPNGAAITQIINQGASTIALVSSTPSQTLGVAVTFTATVTNASGNSGTAPTGTVVFKDGNVSIGNGAISDIGDHIHSSLMFAMSVLTVGSHTINAEYSGDANFSASSTDGTNGNGSPIAQTIGPRTSTITIGAPAAVTVGSERKPSITISDPGAGATAGIFNSTANTLNAGNGRYGHAAVRLLNGKVLIVGGIDGGTNNTADLYDPNGATFTPSAHTLDSGRVAAAATLLQNGTVLIAGGSTDGTAANVVASAEIYDPATDTFTPALGMLGTARFGYAATLLADGSVLITGGEDSGGNTLQSTELFTPGANPATTGAFSAGTPTLNHARFQHTATLLPNGKILLAGGDAGGDAELVDPAVATPV